MTDPMTYPTYYRSSDRPHDRRHDELQYRPYDEFVMSGQFPTVAMYNIIPREENMFGDRASERHSVVIYL